MLPVAATAIPKNESAEKGSIACLLDQASPFHVPLTEAHFFAPDCQLVFRAVRELAEAHQPVSIITVRALLESRGELERAGGDPSRFFDYGGGGDANLANLFPLLEDARRSRETVLHIREHLDDLAALRLDPAQFAEELANKAAPAAASNGGDSAAEILARKEQRFMSGEKKEAFPIGLGPLDRFLDGGFHRGELGVFSGFTGDGKSALLIQAAAHNAEAGRKVRYFTLELPDEDIFDRMACALRGVTMRDEKRLRGALFDLGAMPVHIHQQFGELGEIAAEIRAAVRAGDCDVAVVDYVQRVISKGDTRALAVASVAQTLKNIALREKIVVLTASQLNSNGALFDSSVIGHEADFVFRITEDGLRADKARRGPRDTTLPCHLLGAQSRFVATAKEQVR
jgi:replicative DNA helicase